MFAGYGQYYMGPDYYVNEAVRVYYTNYQNTGPIFTRKLVNGVYFADKVVGFVITARIYENVGSRLLGFSKCLVNGVFNITLPNCMPQYKCRVLNDYFGTEASDIATQDGLTKLLGYIYSQNNVSYIQGPLGYDNPLLQPILYQTYLGLIDLLSADFTNTSTVSQFYDYPAAIDYTL